MYTKSEAKLGGYLFVVYHQTPDDKYFYSLASLHECIGIAVCPPWQHIPSHEKRYHDDTILVTPGVAAECVLYALLHGGLTRLAGTVT